MAIIACYTLYQKGELSNEWNRQELKDSSTGERAHAVGKVAATLIAAAASVALLYFGIHGLSGTGPFSPIHQLNWIPVGVLGGFEGITVIGLAIKAGKSLLKRGDTSQTVETNDTQ